MFNPLSLISKVNPAGVLFWVKSNITLLLASLVMLSAVSGLSYLKGHSSGYEKAYLRAEASKVASLNTVLADVLAHQESAEKFYRNQETSNRLLSEQIDTKIINTKTIIKERMSEPVIITNDCVIDYDSTIGVYRDVAKTAAPFDTVREANPDPSS